MLNLIRKRKIQKIIERNATNGIFGATTPGEFLLSKRKTKKFYISINTIQRTALKNSKLCLYDEIQNWLYFGDCNPALVVSTTPVVITAYSYDIDCVVFLLYPQYYARQYKLKVGMRMLSVNTYGQWKIQQSDIVRGERASGPWNAYRPLIADFLSDDLKSIITKKESINEELLGKM